MRIHIALLGESFPTGFTRVGQFLRVQYHVHFLVTLAWEILTAKLALERSCILGVVGTDVFLLIDPRDFFRADVTLKKLFVLLVHFVFLHMGSISYNKK